MYCSNEKESNREEKPKSLVWKCREILLMRSYKKSNKELETVLFWQSRARVWDSEEKSRPIDWSRSRAKRHQNQILRECH